MREVRFKPVLIAKVFFTPGDVPWIRIKLWDIGWMVALTSRSVRGAIWSLESPLNR